MNLVLVFIGLVAGVLSGLFGIGGGLIVAPALMLLLGYTQRAASGTSLCALLLPVGLLGVINYYKNGAITTTHIYASLLVALGLFLGAYLGSRIAFELNEPLLKRCFAVFLVLVAIKIWFEAK